MVVSFKLRNSAAALLLTAALGLFSVSMSQTLDTVRVDTSAGKNASVDSARADSTVLSDSLKMEQKKSELDTVITYSADSVYFGVTKRITVLERNAVVIYKDMKLTAGRITVDWDNRLLTAEPLIDRVSREKVRGAAAPKEFIFKTPADTSKPDSSEAETVPENNPEIRTPTGAVETDSSGGENAAMTDTVIQTGYPQFIQSGDEIVGSHMTYNLKTKRGYIIEGDTDYGEGYYRGDRIKRTSDDVLNVGEGYFTTCDLDTPHYRFYSKRMKLVVKDKVIAKPVVLYFGKVPVGAVPFAIFSSKSGRQSGLLIPSYGETAQQGRFFQDLGYYFAPSDYWDARATLDFYERKGILLDGGMQYKKRYSLNGSLRGAYTRFHEYGGSSRRWDLIFKHNQVVTPTANAMVDAQFTSDNNFYRDYSSNPLDRLERTLRSNATYRQSFPSFNGSMSLNLNHEKDLDANTSTTTLPRANFRLGQRSIFPQAEGQDDLLWYNKIYYSASSDYTNKRSRQKASGGGFLTREQNVLKNRYSLSTAQTLFLYFNLTPSLSVSQEVTDERKDYRYDQEADSIITTPEDGVFVRHTFSMGAGLGTKLYGTFPGWSKKVVAFRHVMTPSISFSYQPDFSEEFWGYYQYLEDNSGGIHKLDRFSGQYLLGGTPSRRSATMGISLANLFQMKRLKGEEAEKLDLFTLNFGTGYNFTADSLNWSNLSTTFRADPIRGTMVGPVRSMSIDLSTTHSPYATTRTGSLLDRFYFERGNLERGKILRLTNLNLSAGFSFAPPTKKKKEEKPEEEFIEMEEDTLSGDVDLPDVPDIQGSNRLGRDMDFKPAEIPWDLRSNFRYSWTRNNPFIEATKTLWLENSLNVRLTTNWSVSYTNRVDLVQGNIVTSGFTFYRDMHCWEGRFIWNISGVGQGFFLKISVKSPGLRDLKVEKRRGQGGFLGR